MLQLGRKPSHLSLRFRQIMQASRLGLGTEELSGTLSPSALSARLSLMACSSMGLPLPWPLSVEGAMLLKDGRVPQ